MRVFFIYTLFVSTSVILSMIFLDIYEKYTVYLLIYRLYIFAEYSLLSYFFSLNTKQSRFKRILLYSIIPFGIFSLYDFLNSNWDEFTFYPQIVECMVFIFVVVYIFYKKMDTEFSIPIYTTSFFWIANAFLIYFAGNFFLFLFSKTSLEKSYDFNTQYQIIVGSFILVKNILLCTAIYLTKFNKRDKNLNDDIINKIDLGFFAPHDKYTNP